jgi:K+/H+ antiporter YhaU regulatory subunit KhtT
MAGPERCLKAGDKLIVEGTDKVTAGAEAKAVAAK